MSEPSQPIDLVSLRPAAVEAGRNYVAKCGDQSVQIEAIRLISGAPRIWLCRLCPSRREVAIAEVLIRELIRAECSPGQC
jgi:hypothetical protein